MRDLDQGGFGFQRVRTYLGPSLGWTDELVQPSTEIVTGGIHLIAPGESLILVNVAASVQLNLPDVVKWVDQTANQPATGFSRSITVKDIGGNATSFNIVIAPFGQQYIDNIQQAILIDKDRAVVELVPLIDLSGWAVASASSTSGGGGGGDVFKAGNNTYTGINIFTNTTLAVTELAADNSLKVATTAFVKSQNYIDASALASYAPINNPTLTGDPKAPTPAPGDNDTSIATTAFVQQALTGFQPLDADLTSIAGQTLTGTFFYRFADGNWQPVVIGGGLSFIGGTLASTAGGGNVSNVGAPTNGQIAQWTSSTQIQGVDSSTLGFQPLDGDLTAIAALTGTNTIYYRSATNIWSPVTFSGLTFSGGILTVSVAGGNVSTTGTPVVGQIAEWTDATHVQGVSTYAKLASPVFTGDPQAPTPTAGDNDTSIATTAFVTAAVTAGAALGAGRLSFVSTTALKFVPFNGDRIKINGVIYAIPSAGIAGLANTNIFFNGVAGQNLPPNTTCYVYAFNNAGTITGEYSTTGHVTSSTAGNVGVEIKIVDDTRTLIGLIRTTAAAQFADTFNNRSVLSWFNRRPILGEAYFSAAVTTTSTTYVEISTSIRVSFLNWNDCATSIHFSGATYNSGIGSGFTQLFIDSGYMDGNAYGTSSAGGYGTSVGLSGGLGGTTAVGEAYHVATVYGRVTGGTQTWIGGASLPDRSSLSVRTQG